MTHPHPPPQPDHSPREAAVALAREGRPDAALALAQSRPLTPADAAAIAEALLRDQGFNQAVALLRPLAATSPVPAVVGPFVAAGLHAFRRAINDGADITLLHALADAALACPWAIVMPDRVELIRLLETQDLAHRIAPLVACYPTNDRAEMLGCAANAEALHARGAALAAGGRHGRARAAFEAARPLAPRDPVLALNAAFAALADADIAAADSAFADTAPLGEAAMERVLWPRLGEAAWPFLPPPATLADAFAARRPAGAAWPRISIVTPSLNQGDTLERTILSVLHQGYPNLQYILLDPGSTDASRAIIERHRARIDRVILEPDSGQVDALNKGFALADGTLLGWLNADDMLTPGALFALALAWLATPEAEIIHGSCLAARAGGFVGLQIPLADGRGLDSEGLADLHGAWLRGAYFLQPETLFTRSLFDRVGGLDPSLRFVPDYALWARAAGAKVAGTRWPTAIYRLHPAQKTAARRPVLLEQIAVRDALAPLRPAAFPVALVRAALANRPLRILLQRHFLVLDDVTEAQLVEAAASLAPEGILLTVETPPAEAHIVLRITRAHDGPNFVAHLRESGFGGPIIAWLFEDLSDPIAHADIAARYDLLLPRHAEAVPLLRNPHTPVLPAVGEVGVAEAIRAMLASIDDSLGE